MLMHFIIIPLPIVMKKFTNFCIKHQIRQTKIYDMLVYCFFGFKLITVFYIIEYILFRRNYLFPDLEGNKIYEIQIMNYLIMFYF